MGILPRTVDVGVAQDGPRHPGPLKVPHIVLAGELANPIGREGSRGVIFCGGQGAWLAVNRASGRCKDDAAYAVLRAQGQEVQSAQHVDVRIRPGIGD